MTKSQLIERIAGQAPHIPPRRIETIVNAIFEQMAESLRTGERIELRGFGCFTLRTRGARLGRNLHDGLAPLLAGAGLTAERIKAVDDEVKSIVAEAVQFAQSSPEPDPRELYTDVYLEA